MQAIWDLPLKPSQSFGSFVIGPSNQSAFETARRAVEMSDSEIAFLFIHGGAGLGKTHLLNAVALEARDNHQARVRFVRGFDFMAGFLAAQNHKRLPEFREEFRAADILLVDDFDGFAHIPTMSEFVDTVNAFVALKRKVAIAADRLPSMWKGLSEDIRSRLPAPVLISLEKPDAATRLMILKAKCADIGNNTAARLAILRAKCADIEKNGGEAPLPEAMVERLAEGLDGSPREILKRLGYLVNRASHTGEPVTAEQVDAIIAVDRVLDRSASGSQAAPATTHRDTLHCSFCGRSQQEVLRLIAGPTAFICDECIGLSAVMVAKEHRNWRDKWVEDMIRGEDPPAIGFRGFTSPKA